MDVASGAVLTPLQAVEINRSDTVMSSSARKADIRRARLRRFDACLSQLSPHARLKGVEPQSEGRQLKLENIQFLRSLIVPPVHDDCVPWTREMLESELGLSNILFS